MFGIFNRFLAFVVVSVSLATPCFADLVFHDGKDVKSSVYSLCDGSAEKCKGEVPKAVISRSDDIVSQAVLSVSGDGGEIPVVGTVYYSRRANRQPDRQITTAGMCGVDLYVLCRMLN